MNGTELDKQFLQRLGDRIRAAREYSKLSQEELANQLKPTCKPQDIAKIEVGFSALSVTDLNRIAFILDAPLYHFIDDGALFRCEDQRFVEAYSVLTVEARNKVREVVFALAGDNPLYHS